MAYNDWKDGIQSNPKAKEVKKKVVEADKYKMPFHGKSLYKDLFKDPQKEHQKEIQMEKMQQARITRIYKSYSK